jgi:hypothetical protein
MDGGWQQLSSSSSTGTGGGGEKTADGVNLIPCVKLLGTE